MTIHLLVDIAYHSWLHFLLLWALFEHVYYQWENHDGEIACQVCEGRRCGGQWWGSYSYFYCEALPILQGIITIGSLRCIGCCESLHYSFYWTSPLLSIQVFTPSSLLLPSEFKNGLKKYGELINAKIVKNKGKDSCIGSSMSSSSPPSWPGSLQGEEAEGSRLYLLPNQYLCLHYW